jgi:tRNA (guanine-N7-)-methyltransferase
VLELGCGRDILLVLPKDILINFVGIDIKGLVFGVIASKTAVGSGLQCETHSAQIELINHIFAENEVDEIWITFQIHK